MRIEKILQTKESAAFLSFLIGLGVAILFFHKPFQYKQRLSLPVHRIEGKHIRHGDKCYSYHTEDTLCPLVNKNG